VKNQAPQSALFGLLSVTVFCFGVLTLFIDSIGAKAGGESMRLEQIREFVIFGAVVFGLGSTFGGLGLFRSEHPRWLAGLGLLLCLALLTICLLFLLATIPCQH
jgi:hypothetical protein